MLVKEKLGNVAQLQCLGNNQEAKTIYVSLHVLQGSTNFQRMKLKDMIKM